MQPLAGAIGVGDLVQHVLLDLDTKVVPYHNDLMSLYVETTSGQGVLTILHLGYFKRDPAFQIHVEHHARSSLSIEIFRHYLLIRLVDELTFRGSA
jgi:hypothetical protein